MTLPLPLTAAQLKSRFMTGARPDETDYAMLIDAAFSAAPALEMLTGRQFELAERLAQVEADLKQVIAALAEIRTSEQAPPGQEVIDSLQDRLTATSERLAMLEQQQGQTSSLAEPAPAVAMQRSASPRRKSPNASQTNKGNHDRSRS
ncbi:hypothetical protein [Parachitinimonas caeni]|uniref:Uncharacterized protein n=1 Tax=Parachitinimonas caeni TaxID=3031301 RepID=A0ABT7E217_9NEIS|nr:hypothetical protein [Parachitinimonas caeni]MDK2125455.1 hypothetical protein [Parachitinimonas caeni]